MTICIGAIARNKVLAITDKMLTLNNPGMVTKYEITENNKAIPLTTRVVGLFAGDVIHGNGILTTVRAKLQALTDTPGQVRLPSVQEPTNMTTIAAIVQETYREQWIKLVEENLLNRYGMTLGVFMASHNRLDPDLVKKINNILGEFNLGVEIIIVGIDSQPHVYLINNPGTITSFDSIAYACIGSGSQHATLSLIESGYNKSINEAEGLYALLEAKKRAEFDPGVGQLCDIVVIDTAVTTMPQQQIKQITAEHKRSEKEIKKIITRTSQKIARMI